jgi:hypothetical protein
MPEGRDRGATLRDAGMRLNLWLVGVTLAGVLAVDQYGGLAGQLAASVWMWAVFFRLLGTSAPEWRVPFYACLVWGAAGEMFLSLVWGLYTYQLENIPFFIPPGHVLMLWLGLLIAPRVPKWFVAAVPVLVALYVLAALWYRFDTFSVLLAGMFVLCMFRQEGRELYAAMFVLSLALELYGTWLGNWQWHPEVAHFGLTSFNPPLAAGAFYCALDVLVAITARRLARAPKQRAPEAGMEPAG